MRSSQELRNFRELSAWRAASSWAFEGGCSFSSSFFFSLHALHTEQAAKGLCLASPPPCPLDAGRCDLVPTCFLLAPSACALSRYPAPSSRTHLHLHHFRETKPVFWAPPRPRVVPHVPLPPAPEVLLFSGQCVEQAEERGREEAEEEGDGRLTRPPRQPASKSSTLSKWGVDSNPLGFWRPRQPSKTRRGWPVSGRSGTRSLHSRRKSLRQLSSVPLFPPLPLPLPTPPSRSLQTPRPTVPVPLPPSPSGRFAVVLRSRGEELIGFVVTSRSCQELTSALVTDEDITVTGSETAQLASQATNRAMLI